MTQLAARALVFSQWHVAHDAPVPGDRRYAQDIVLEDRGLGDLHTPPLFLSHRLEHVK
jgi:hypothetical protein